MTPYNTKAMKLLRLSAIALALAIVAGAAPAVVLIVRHAEKEALPADDPPLTAAVVTALRS